MRRLKFASVLGKLPVEYDPELLEGAWYCPCGGFQPRFGVFGDIHDTSYQGAHKIIRGTKSRNIYKKY